MTMTLFWTDKTSRNIGSAISPCLCGEDYVRWMIKRHNWYQALQTLKMLSAQQLLLNFPNFSSSCTSTNSCCTYAGSTEDPTVLFPVVCVYPWSQPDCLIQHNKPDEVTCHYLTFICTLLTLDEWNKKDIHLHRKAKLIDVSGLNKFHCFLSILWWLLLGKSFPLFHAVCQYCLWPHLCLQNFMFN